MCSGEGQTAPTGWRDMCCGDHVASGLQKLKPPLPVCVSGAGDWAPRYESTDKRPPGGDCMYATSCLSYPGIVAMVSQAL